ncbi:ArnT family glycosyltransferase [Sutcliffiella sp. NPDC057660]|uniref:ArnT family glycosyltransferase n=1 Tax=Sutcliffiella sp. NPDC057660 TaxID=3346199 RepID=UPI0036839D49
MRNIFSTRFFSYGLNIIALVCFTLFLVATYVQVQLPDSEFSAKKIAFWVVVLCGFLPLFSFIMTKYLSKRKFLFVLIGISLLLRLGWAYFMKTPLASDFLFMFDGAVNISRGDYSFTEDFYFQKWTYQLGFTSYEAIIVSLFGETPRALKLLNILYSVGICLLVYLSGTRLFNEMAGRIAALFYAFYVPSVIMSSVLTNQHLSTFLFFLAFYLVISGGLEKKYHWIAIGSLIGLGNIARPLGSFSLLAIGVYFVFLYMLGFDWRKIVASGRKVAGIIIMYVLIQQLVSFSITGLGITDHSMANKDSLWKFVIGFNHETKGHYSPVDQKYLDQFSLWDERNEKAKELITERLADKEKVYELLVDKFTIMWGAKDSTVFWSLFGLDHTPEFALFLYTAERVMFLALAIYAIIAVIGYFKMKDRYHHLLFLILILGYAAVHILIEIQTRYRFDMMPALFILSGHGVYMTVNVFQKFIGKKEQTIQG